MKDKHIRLELNKREDWQGGFLSNIAMSGDSLVLENTALLRGFACLPPVDSRQNGFEWDRVTLDTRKYEDNMIRVFAAASDYPDTIELGLLDESTKGLSHERAMRQIQQFYGAPAAASDDFLLELTGRYLWLAVEMISTGERMPVLRGISIQMSGDHMIDYLPLIYREGGSFTKRFISLFDSFCMDMENMIYELPSLIDYENAEGALLRLFASWVCLDTDGFSDIEIRRMIKSCVSDYEKLYTREGVKHSVQMLTGKTPVLIENQDVSPNREDCRDPELYRRLYGENPNKLFILLEDGTFRTRRQMERFIERMTGLLPANVEFELVLLKRGVRLDWHTYLGVNTYIDGYSSLSIDENVAIQYNSIIGRNEH